MEFRDVVRRRRMVRVYDPDRAVPRDVVDELLGLAVRAPSAGFTQGWRFLVLDTPASRNSYWAATTDANAEPNAWLRGMRTAPVIIVAFSDEFAYVDRYAAPDKNRTAARWPIPYWHVDTGMAAFLVLLGAVDAGLDACFFGVPGERWDALRRAFAVPQRLTPVGAISLGHRAATERSRPSRGTRRPATEIVAYGGFDQPSGAFNPPS
jgi:nitroreductase